MTVSSYLLTVSCDVSLPGRQCPLRSGEEGADSGQANPAQFRNLGLVWWLAVSSQCHSIAGPTVTSRLRSVTGADLSPLILPVRPPVTTSIPLIIADIN